MDSTETEPTSPRCYALFIGINCYIEPKQHLKGAVRDAAELEAFVREAYRDKPSAIRIRLLTATCGPEDDKSESPVEDAHLWPTFENVTAELEIVATRCMPGDRVYIHFSGHGTRMRPERPPANEAVGDLALVLLATDGRTRRYLRGIELASRLEAIAARGAHLSIILDCCFSGSVLRQHDNDDDTGIREVAYDPAVDERYPPLLYQSSSPRLAVATGVDPRMPVLGLDNRDVAVLPPWILEPKGYTILAACGPTEIAREIRFTQEERHGILSYFLLRTLLTRPATRTGPLSLGGLYEHVCARLKEHYKDYPKSPRQSPMLFGNKMLPFPTASDVGGTSGCVASDAQKPAFLLFKTSAGVIWLLAGQAHGVSNGDIFTLCSPQELAKPRARRCNQLLAQVAKAGNLTSTLELQTSCGAEERVAQAKRIRRGWVAEHTTKMLLLQYATLIAPEIPYGEDLAAAVTNRGLSARFPGHDTTSLASSGPPGLLSVGRNSGNPGYCISITSPPGVTPIHIASLPLQRSGRDSDTIREDISRQFLLDALEHLVRFTLFKTLRNPQTQLAASFSAQLITQSDETFFPGETTIVVPNDSHIELRIQNLGRTPLHIHMYDLGPQWQIENILGESTDYEVVPGMNGGSLSNEGYGDPNTSIYQPKNVVKTALVMSIPEKLREDGHTQCEDVLKVFVTTQQTSFLTLELPRLKDGREITHSRNTDEEVRQRLPRLRGSEDGISETVSEDWTTVEFVIRTVLP